VIPGAASCCIQGAPTVSTNRLPAMSLTLTRSDLMCSRNFIAGEWRDSCAGRWHDVSDPASGTVFARVPDNGPADAKEAVDAAHAAFNDWRALTARARGQLAKQLPLAGSKSQATDVRGRGTDWTTTCTPNISATGRSCDSNTFA
jgi:hypothetical protein